MILSDDKKKKSKKIKKNKIKNIWRRSQTLLIGSAAQPNPIVLVWLSTQIQ